LFTVGQACVWELKMLLNDTSYVDSVRGCVHAKSCVCVCVFNNVCFDRFSSWLNWDYSLLWWQISILKMEAAGSSKMVVSVYQIAWHHTQIYGGMNVIRFFPYLNWFKKYVECFNCWLGYSLTKFRIRARN